MSLPLHRHVIELSRGIAGAYCGKLLRDSGSLVSSIVGTSGHPLRVGGASADALADHLSADKEIVVVEDVVSAGRGMLRGDEILVEDLGPGVVDVDGLRTRFPDLIVVSISPYGRTGPWAQRPWSDLSLQAGAGSLAKRGLADREPLQAGGQVLQWVAGSYAAAGAMALQSSSLHGRAARTLDVSMFECVAVSLQTFGIIEEAFRHGAGPAPLRRGPAIPSIEPTADGYVGFSTITAQQFQDFLLMIERPDLASDTSLLVPANRQLRKDELNAAIHDWTMKYTSDEIVEQATLYRIPVAPIGNGAAVREFDHLIDRQVFGSDNGRSAPRRPYSITAGTDAETKTEDRERDDTDTPSADLPLAGLRVADFTAFWSGPAATHFLAALGADVVKVESAHRPDGMRFTVVEAGQDHWWERGTVFHGVNANKRAVTADLTRHEGLAIAERLVRWADVVIENFSPRVMDKFGLGWDRVQRLNPRAVMVRMPAFGLSGPWRDRTGFAMTVEQVSGLAWRTGYADGPPMDVGGVCDPVGGMHAVVGLFAALAERDQTGVGQLVEAPLVEAALNVAAEQIIVHGANGDLLTRQGNRDDRATQGVYPCRGDDQWIALTVRDDSDWAQVGQVFGAPEWATAAQFAHAADRRRHQDALDEYLSGATARRDRDELADALVRHGVPAAPVVRPEQIIDNPQLRARGFFAEVDHPFEGRYTLPSLPLVCHEVDADLIRTAPPTLGQHNHSVLHDVLGYDETELAALEAVDVIGTTLRTA